MTYVRPIISILLLGGLLYILSSPLKVGSSSTPPLGQFMNPFSGFWNNAETEVDGISEIDVSDLGEDVSILYDDRNVPHIFAENMEDLLFAQGYVIAKERLWQMDIMTRAVEGKTAEVLGAASIERDKGARERGLARSAQLADQSWRENREGYQLIERFTEGINHFITHLSPKDYPLEFKLLNYEPQLWSPYRTALFIKAMSITLNSRQQDIPSTNALTTFGQDTFYDLYPDRNKKQSPIVQDVQWSSPSISFEQKVSEDLEMIFDHKSRTGHESFIGSNNFAVDGSKTKSGSPILANDPHLKLSLPSIWIEMHLVSPGMNVYGVSLPSMPGITIGFNEDISWGQTNVGHDVFDIYRVDWVDESKLEYWIDGEKLKTEMIEEKIEVKDAEMVIDTVLYTQWGPIIKEDGIHTDLARRWVSDDKPSPEEIEVFININQAKNYEEFRSALQHFYAPAQNFIFSSKSGDIGMNITGKLPVKVDQQGRFIQDGSKNSSAWKGFIPFDELPQEFNPKRNYVASANQHSADDQYPYYYNGGFEDFRGRYINRQLEQMRDVSKEEIMNLQLDAYSLKVEESLPLMLEELDTKTLTKKEKAVVNQLAKWNYVYTAQSEASTAYELWWDKFYEMTFDEITKVRTKIDIPYVEAFRLIEMMEDGHWIFDVAETEEKEDFRDIVNKSFRTVGFDTLNLETWSEERNTLISHATNISSLGYDEIDSPGHPNTPNAISKFNGPSWRMVVDMSDPVKGYGVYPGGVSGNPGSPYYDNFVEDWDNGQYYELNNSSDRNKIDERFTLILKAEK